MFFCYSNALWICELRLFRGALGPDQQHRLVDSRGLLIALHLQYGIESTDGSADGEGG